MHRIGARNIPIAMQSICHSKRCASALRSFLGQERNFAPFNVCPMAHETSNFFVSLCIRCAICVHVFLKPTLLLIALAVCERWPEYYKKTGLMETEFVSGFKPKLRFTSSPAAAVTLVGDRSKESPFNGRPDEAAPRGMVAL